MKITNENIIRSDIAKEYEIELDNGETLRVSKRWIDDERYVYDNNCEIIDEDVFKELNEEEQDKVMDFIDEINSIT